MRARRYTKGEDIVVTENRNGKAKEVEQEVATETNIRYEDVPLSVKALAHNIYMRKNNKAVIALMSRIKKSAEHSRKTI